MRTTDKFSDLWGKHVAAEGFTATPKALQTRFRELGLDHNDVAVLNALIHHWWIHDKPPFPTIDTIMFLSGLSHATVCRRLVKLEQLKIIASHTEGRRTYRSLDGLVEQLETLVLSQRETDKPVDMSQRETRSKRRKETYEVDEHSSFARNIRRDLLEVVPVDEVDDEVLDRVERLEARWAS